MNRAGKSRGRTEMDEQIIPGQPETANELVHKYGTYNIQPTSESENVFPTIAAGLAKQVIEAAKEEQEQHSREDG